MEFFSNVGLDSLKPSLFELISQEQLRDLLQPALKYVLAVRQSHTSPCQPSSINTLQVFAQRYPRYLLRIVNKHEEFYAALMLVVEQHYLRKHGGSCHSLRPCPRVQLFIFRCIVRGTLLRSEKETQTVRRAAEGESSNRRSTRRRTAPPDRHTSFPTLLSASTSFKYRD